MRKRKKKSERTEARIIVLLTTDEKREVTRLVRKLRQNGTRTSSAAFARKAVVERARRVAKVQRLRAGAAR